MLGAVRLPNPHVSEFWIRRTNHRKFYHDCELIIIRALGLWKQEKEGDFLRGLSVAQAPTSYLARSGFLK
jgi:hypothetical protein